jgi:hypothetical protein
VKQSIAFAAWLLIGWLHAGFVAADLKPGEGADLVRGHCSACHSLSLVTAQRGDRAYWLKTIRWMQKTQNLWPLPPEHEAAILAYLDKYYNETEWGRRPPLAGSLMPPD